LKRLEEAWGGLGRLEEAWGGLTKLEGAWGGLKRLEVAWGGVGGLRSLEEAWGSLTKLEEAWGGLRKFEDACGSVSRAHGGLARLGKSHEHESNNKKQLFAFLGGAPPEACKKTMCVCAILLRRLLRIIFVFQAKWADRGGDWSRAWTPNLCKDRQVSYS
jgi:hypothetical protein